MKFLYLLLSLLFISFNAQNKRISNQKSTSATTSDAINYILGKDGGATFKDGGNDNFRKLIQQNLRVSKINVQTPLSTEIYFVIDTFGNLVNVQAYGSNEIFNTEAMRAVLLIDGEWYPGVINGKAVKQKLKIPLKLNY